MCCDPGVLYHPVPSSIIHCEQAGGPLIAAAARQLLFPLQLRSARERSIIPTIKECFWEELPEHFVMDLSSDFTCYSDSRA